ncbi:MAG: hypothetical protein AAF702_05155 [Chloroflexota bacterium]
MTITSSDSPEPTTPEMSNIHGSQKAVLRKITSINVKRKIHLLSPKNTVIAAVVGIVVGGILFLAGSQVNPESAKFVKTPQFITWYLLILILPAYWSIVVIPLWQSVGDFDQPKRTTFITVLGSALVIIVGLAVEPILTYATGSGSFSFVESPLAYHWIRMSILMTLGLATVAPAVTGIWYVSRTASQIASQSRIHNEHIEALVWLRVRLQWYITVLGIVVGLVTLATGALRNAILAFDPIQKTTFTVEIVLVYGGLFTLLLAFVYVPVHQSLLRVGRYVRDEAFPINSLSRSNWDEWFSRRNDFEELLHLKSNSYESFQTGVLILGPLLTGLVAILLEQ